MAKKNMDKKFESERCVVTMGVNEKMNESASFLNFVIISIGRHFNGDWGEMPEEDKKENERSLKSGFGRLMSAYIFNKGKFEETFQNEAHEEPKKSWLELKEQASLFDSLYSDCPAQYTKEDGTPIMAWDNVKTKLSDLDTKKLHYILTQAKEPNLIVVDFDLKDPETCEKSFELNFEAASKWPKTYAEVSKSGKAIHLHYIYSGDINQLAMLYDTDIEVKVFKGKSSLRRALSLCNDIPIATISSGLPLKKGDKVVNEQTIKSEKGLRNLIVRNLNKEIHSSTASSVDFIYHILEDAYNSGVPYDISDMKPAIITFAAGSTHQSDKCLEQVSQMKFKSKEAGEHVDDDETKIWIITEWDRSVTTVLFPHEY